MLIKCYSCGEYVPTEHVEFGKSRAYEIPPHAVKKGGNCPGGLYAPPGLIFEEEAGWCEGSTGRYAPLTQPEWLKSTTD